MDVLNRRCAALALVALALLPRAVAAQGSITGAQAKAGFLYNATIFVEWPAGVLRDGILLCVVGDGGTAPLVTAMRGQMVNGRALRGAVLHPGDDPRACHIVLIDTDDPGVAQMLLDRIGAAPVLTVSEQSDFTRRGGIVRLYTEQARLRFEINTSSLERAGLRVSAKMLGLARIVR